MTTVIEYYGGPGIGKSTVAANTFTKLKEQNFSCELVQEYAKDWVWINREIKQWDQFYIFGKQFQKENILYNKVDYIITDCPLWLIAFYEQYNVDLDVCTKAMQAIEKELFRKVSRFRIFLDRSEYEYKEAERFHSYEQAIEIDGLLKDYLKENNIGFIQK